MRHQISEKPVLPGDENANYRPERDAEDNHASPDDLIKGHDCLSAHRRARWLLFGSCGFLRLYLGNALLALLAFLLCWQLIPTLWADCAGVEAADLTALSAHWKVVLFRVVDSHRVTLCCSGLAEALAHKGSGKIT